MAGKKKNAYSLAKPVAPNTVLRDNSKKQWFVGEPIGQGGFGCIYSAKAEGDKKYSYVVKIEPKENGPLFTEIHFYIRVCQPSQIESWRMQNSLQHLGIPRYLGSGLMTHTNQSSCRFLIMDRFTGDFENLLTKRQVSPADTVKVANQVVNALEYLHSNDYVHADIKASNLLYMGTLDRVYLVDFGLVGLFRKNGLHCVAKPDPKLKHNGTLEFCARDAHTGLRPSRRGDLESLAFNLIHWLARCQPGAAQMHATGLPWASLIPDNRSCGSAPVRVKEAVAVAKGKAMQNPRQLLSLTPGLADCKGMLDFLESVSRLGYEETPDYAILRAALSSIRLKVTQKTRRDPSLGSPAPVCVGAGKRIRRTPASPATRTPPSGSAAKAIRKPALTSSTTGGKLVVRSPRHPSAAPLVSPIPVKPLRLHNERTSGQRMDQLRPTTPRLVSKLSPLVSSVGHQPAASTSLSDLFSSSGDEQLTGAIRSPPAMKPASRPASSRRSAGCQTSPELLAIARREVTLRRQRRGVRE